MNKCWYALALLALFAACKNSGKPDIGGIKAPVVEKTFYRDFFALDSLNPEPGLDGLQQKYPRFLSPFIATVLGLDPAHPEAVAAIKAFLGSYRDIYRQADSVYNQNHKAWADDVEKSLRYFKYYLPEKRIDSPFVLTAFLGPMDAYEPFTIGDYGEVRTADGAGIALQFHLGKDAAIYKSGEAAGALYGYQSRRFEPATVPVNIMKAVIEDAYPPRPGSSSLAEEFVEKGKRLYLLGLIMPDTPDSLLLGYTGLQYEGCKKNESVIWNFFVKNDLLFQKDIAILQNYIRDGPKTVEIGEGSPGNIALFVGRQIVRSYMEKFPETAPAQLMGLDNKAIFDQAAYKP